MIFEIVNLLPWRCAWDAFLWMVQVTFTFIDCLLHLGIRIVQLSSHYFIILLSDHYGRLPTIIISNLIALVTGIATPFVTEHVSFFILRYHSFVSDFNQVHMISFRIDFRRFRFLMGLSFNTFFTVPYTLGKDLIKSSQANNRDQLNKRKKKTITNSC